MSDQAQMPGGDASSLETSPLPAPYRNPWRSLVDDLRAVVADLRLRLQEFWRRNGDGSLWVPKAWPRDLAPLFWPLVLGVSVVVLVTTGLQVSARLRAAPPVMSSVPSPAPARPSEVDDGVPPEASDDRSVFEAPPDEPARPSQQSPSVAPAAPEQLEEPLPAEPDALLALVLGRDPQVSAAPAADESAPVIAAVADSALNTVEITLGNGWSALMPETRQGLAEGWWERIDREGYSALTLKSENGVVLGRSARVGKGMILNALP